MDENSSRRLGAACAASKAFGHAARTEASLTCPTAGQICCVARHGTTAQWVERERGSTHAPTHGAPPCSGPSGPSEEPRD